MYQVKKNNLFLILFWNNVTFPERVIYFLSFVSEQYRYSPILHLQDFRTHNKAPGRNDSWWLAAKALPPTLNCLLLKRATRPDITPLPRNSLHPWQPDLGVGLGWEGSRFMPSSWNNSAEPPSFTAPHRGALFACFTAQLLSLPTDFPHAPTGAHLKSPPHSTFWILIFAYKFPS